MTTFNVGADIRGLRPVLQTLRVLEPTVYKEITKELKKTAEPLRKNVADGFPTRPWSSGSGGKTKWERYGRVDRGRRPPDQEGASFPRYDARKVRAGVKVKVGGRRRRDGSYPIMSIRQNNAAGAIYDLAQRAHTASGRTFVSNLRQSGNASRVMWKRVEAGYPKIERALTAIIAKVGKQFSEQIERSSQQRELASMRARAQARDTSGRFGAR